MIVAPERRPLQGTYGSLLLRGLLAGLLAGVIAGGVAFLLGEPHIDAAIAVEESAAASETTAGHSHGDDEALVSRTGQKFGLFLATGLTGLAMGAVFATVAHYARRFSQLPAATFALVLAGAMWLGLAAVPFFKYPANPPAVGDPETINQRTWLWLAAVVLGFAAVLAAAYVRHLGARWTMTTRAAASLGAFLAVVTVGYLALPTMDEVGADFPATLLWQFRISSFATQATLWLALGLAFAFLTERARSAALAKRAH
jgi:hypothetical protein